MRKYILFGYRIGALLTSLAFAAHDAPPSSAAPAACSPPAGLYSARALRRMRREAMMRYLLWKRARMQQAFERLERGDRIDDVIAADDAARSKVPGGIPRIDRAKGAHETTWPYEPPTDPMRCARSSIRS